MACVAYVGRKEVGHRCGLRFLLCTRVTCQLMWPSWDVNRSGKNQMFSFTSGASTLFLSRRWQANMSRYWPWDSGPLGEVTHSELGFRKHQDLTLCETGSSPDLCTARCCILSAKHGPVTSLSDVLLMQIRTDQDPGSCGSIHLTTDSNTWKNLKMCFVTPLRSDLMCVHVVWGIHVRLGSRGWRRFLD